MPIRPKNLTKQLRRRYATSYMPDVAAGSVQSIPFFYTNHRVEVTAVYIVPDSDITGADTNNFKAAVQNAGTDGSGTDEVAGLTFSSGTDASSKQATELTLDETNLKVDVGEVLVFDKSENGTGLEQPELQVVVEYEVDEEEGVR